MAFIQKTKAPVPDIRYFSIPDFSGGVNNRDGYTELANNEAINILNMDIFTEVGVAKQRSGTVRVGTFVSSSPVRFIDEYKLSQQTHQDVFGTDDVLYINNTSVKSGGTSVARGVTFNNKYMFVNGTGIYYYGVFPQTSDTYTEIVGTATTSPIVMKLVSTTPGYTPLPAQHTFGKTIYNYTLGTVEYQPCENEVGDEYKGASFIPTTPKLIESKEGRVYLAGDDTLQHSLFVSDIGNPFYFPVALGLQLTPNGDKINTIKEFHDAIVVGRTNDIYAVYGNSNRSNAYDDVYIIKKIDTHTGIASPDTMKHVNNYMYFLGGDGNVYSLHTPQTNTELLATKLINDKLDFFKFPATATRADMNTACAIYHKDLYWLSLGDKVYVYSFLSQAWSIYDGFNARSFYIKDGSLIFGNSNGMIAKYGEGYNDFTEAVSSIWQSKRFDMNMPSNFKKFKSMYLISHVFDDADADINVTFEIDHENVSMVAEIKNMISRWGTAVFGDRFITRNVNKSLPISINKRGRLLSVIFANNKLNQSLKVYEINGEYELRGFR